MRKITQNDINRITDVSLKSWARYQVKNGVELPENDEERISIAQHELDLENLNIMKQILEIKK